MSPPNPSSQRILRRAQVRQRIGKSDTTLWRWERDGKFPERVQLTEGGSVGWYEDEIDAWVASRVRGFGARPKVGPKAPGAKVMPPRAAVSPPTVAQAKAAGELSADLDFLDDDDFFLGHLPKGGFVSWTPPRRLDQSPAAPDDAHE